MFDGMVKVKSEKKINKAWHSKNKMPMSPSLKTRAARHLRHAKDCGCREAPKSVQDYLKNNKIAV